METKLDILVIVAHPDDAELGCGGTIAKQISLGYKVGIVDLTRGELGSRGSVETRKAESAASDKILGVSVRENLEMPDGFFENNKANQLLVIEQIRKYRPEIIVTNAKEDRHIDHGRAAKLVSDASFLSGLIKIKTNYPHYRPKHLYYMIQDRYLKPDFVIDVTDFWDLKMQSILAYKTQFFNPSLDEPQTPISGEDFLRFLEARARDLGRNIGVDFAEGFVNSRIVGVQDFFSLF